MADLNLRSLYCPRCEYRPLEHGSHDGHELDVCQRCGGLWVMPAKWDYERLGPLPGRGRGEHLVPIEMVESSPSDPQHVQLKPTAGIQCPVCVTPLTGLLLGEGRHSTCEIDQCPKCGGVWFDQGEWSHVAALHNFERHQRSTDTPTTWGQWAFQLVSGLPVEFNVKSHSKPYVTIGLIVICVIVFILEMILGPEAVWEQFAMRPADVGSGVHVWTVFTAMFLHANFLHLFGNMYFLYVLGDNVEDVLGRWRFLGFYLLCGVAADALRLVADPTGEIVSLGASGAIAGVMAAYLLLFHRAQLTFMILVFQWKMPAWGWLGIWLAIQLFGLAMDPTGEQSGIGWLAHVGGFAAGLLLIWPFRDSLIRSSPILRVMHDVRA